MDISNLYPPEPPNNVLEFILPPLENGIKKVISKSLLPQVAIDSTMSNLLSTTVPKKKIKIVFKKNVNSVTVESQALDKKTILTDKSNTCEQTIQTIKLSQTLDRVSTSQERAFEPYWNCQVGELSKKLWLPIEIDSVGSPLNSSNGYFQSMEQNSWFSIKQWKHHNLLNLPKTSLLSSMSSIVGSMEEGSTIKKKKNKAAPKKTLLTKTKKPMVNSSRVIKLKNLKAEDIRVFRQWFGCYRKTYNLALDSLKNNWKNTPLNQYWLRNRFVTKWNVPKNLSYLLDTPKHIRECAMKELVTAYKTNLEKRKQNPNFTFDVKFKSKKEKNVTIPIPFSGIKSSKDPNNQTYIKMFPTFLQNRLEYFVKRNKDVDITRDCRLRMSPLGNFYLHVPMSVSAPESQGGNKDTVISLDPGVRTFLTGYSPSTNTCYKFADKDISRLQRLCCHLDKLISLTAKKKGHCHHINRMKMKKAQYRLRLKIKNLVKEVHCKTIHFLRHNFSTIIIPNTKIKEIVKKKNRKINNKTARQMLTWSHYTFRQRLITKVKGDNITIIEGGEEYTSKTCSNCGCLNHHLGGQKMFHCKQCKVKMDRDVNGSRGILLKLLTSASRTSS